MGRRVGKEKAEQIAGNPFHNGRDIPDGIEPFRMLYSVIHGRYPRAFRDHLEVAEMKRWLRPKETFTVLRIKQWELVEQIEFIGDNARTENGKGQNDQDLFEGGRKSYFHFC